MVKVLGFIILEWWPSQHMRMPHTDSMRARHQSDVLQHPMFRVQAGFMRQMPGFRVFQAKQFRQLLVTHPSVPVSLPPPPHTRCSSPNTHMHPLSVCLSLNSFASREPPRAALLPPKHPPPAPPLQCPSSPPPLAPPPLPCPPHLVQCWCDVDGVCCCCCRLMRLPHVHSTPGHPQAHTATRTTRHRHSIPGQQEGGGGGGRV